MKIVQWYSWDGLVTKWYDSPGGLGLDGGFSRALRHNINPKTLAQAIANSQYVKSDDYGLRVVAQSGRRIKTIFPKESKFSHTYGRTVSQTPSYINKKIIERKKRLYIKRMRMLQRRG